MNHSLRNFNSALLIIGILLLNLHFVSLQVEYFFPYRKIIFILDAFVLLAVFYLIKKSKENLIALPALVSFLPLLYLVYELKANLLSEYSVWIYLIKIVLLFSFINIRLKKEPAAGFWYRKFPFFFFLFLLILPSLFYVLVDFTPPSWDPARHSKNAFYIFNMLFYEKDGLFQGYMHYDLYPSLSYLVSIPFILLFGKSNTSLVFSIILFWLPISYYYFYKIAKDIFKVTDHHATLISFIYHSNIIFLSLYKQFMLDFQPIVLLSIYYYYIWKSTYFNQRKYSIISGILLGIGILSKQSFILFIAPLLLLFIGKIVWNTWKTRNNTNIRYFNRWTNFFLHLVLAFALVVPWFEGWQFLYTYEMSTHTELAKLEGDPDPLSVASLIWYFPWLIYTYTWPIIILLLTGWAVLIKKTERFQIHKSFAVVSMTVIFLILTVTYNKDIRYISGIFFYAGFGFIGLGYLKNKLRTPVLLTASLICLGYSIHLISWAKPDVPGIDLSNYGLPTSPASPSYPNEAKAVAAFEKIYSNLPFSENNKALVHHFLKNDNSYHEYSLAMERNQYAIPSPPVYDSVIHKNRSVKEFFKSEYTRISGLQNDSAFYLFGRDFLYPSFYLLNLQRNDRKGTIQKAGFVGDVPANLRLFIHKFAGDSLIEIQEGWIVDNNLTFSIPEKCNKIEVAITVHHYKARWQLIFLNKVTPYFRNDYINTAFVPYSSQINNSGNWIINLK